MAETKSVTNTKIWDIWIRLFHWLLALSIGFLLLSGETGFQFFEWHKNVGEFVVALLLFRLIWSFVGSSNASLFRLITNPMRAVSHLFDLARGKVHQDRGHNAAGGWAVLIMLLLVGFQAVSGLFIADEDELIEGAFYGALDAGLSETLLHLHHTNARIIMAVVALHVLMVFVYLIRAGQNLITPMITGRMRWRDNDAPVAVKFAQPMVGLVLLVVCIGAAGVVLGWFG